MRGRRRGGGRRCLERGCGRAVQPGHVYCMEHRESAAGRAAAEAVRRMAAVDGQTDRRTDGQTDEHGEGAGERFRRRLERGDYRGLLDERVREVMAQAEERGLGEEIGALRFALMRVLAEEEDPVRLSLAVSRLATASARLARAKQALDHGYEPLNEAIAQILRELDGEREGRE